MDLQLSYLYNAIYYTNNIAFVFKQLPADLW